MKNQDIIDNVQKLRTLQDSTTIRFGARVSFAIIRNLHILEPIAQDIQNAYSILIQKYGKPIQDEDNSYKINVEDLDTFKQEIKNLENIDTAVNIIKIKFSDIEHQSLSVKEMDALYFMIDTEED